MEEKNSVPFKVLWIADCTVAALDRRFLSRLWEEILGTQPVVKTVIMPDDDMVLLGGPLAHTYVIIDIRRKGELRGYIHLWIDDLSAAAASLESRAVPFTRSKTCYEGLVIDRTYLGEQTLEVRLEQAPIDILERYRSLQAYDDLAAVMHSAFLDRDLLNQTWIHRRYGGRWIAIENAKIIADGTSREAIAEVLKTMDVQDALVSYVYPPTEPEPIVRRK